MHRWSCAGHRGGGRPRWLALGWTGALPHGEGSAQRRPGSCPSWTSVLGGVPGRLVASVPGRRRAVMSGQHRLPFDGHVHDALVALLVLDLRATQRNLVPARRTLPWRQAVTPGMVPSHWPPHLRVVAGACSQAVGQVPRWMPPVPPQDRAGTAAGRRRAVGLPAPTPAVHGEPWDPCPVHPDRLRAELRAA